MNQIKPTHKKKKKVPKTTTSMWILFLIKLWTLKYIFITIILSIIIYLYLCSPFPWPFSILLSPITSQFCFIEQNSPKQILLTRHFIDAFSEISNSIPHFEKIPLVKDKYAQYGIRRRQLDMIDNLVLTIPHIGEEELIHQIISIKDQMLSLHEKTVNSEDGFKDAVAMIETTTSYILRELPQLQYFLERNELQKAVIQLAVVTKSLSSLIRSLEETITPITSLRLIVTRLVSDINIMQTNLQLLDHRTNVRLISRDYTKEEENKGWHLWKFSETDKSKEAYEELILFNRYIADMKEASHFLDQTFEQSELQVQIALDHLRGASRRLSLIYTDIGRSSNKITLQQIDNLLFTEEQLNELNFINQETIRKIKTIRDDNEPVLSAISIHGYGAIGDGKE